MRLKLDENLSRKLKPALRGLGHNPLTAADEGLLSRPDMPVHTDLWQSTGLLWISYGKRT